MVVVDVVVVIVGVEFETHGYQSIKLWYEIGRLARLITLFPFDDQNTSR